MTEIPDRDDPMPEPDYTIETDPQEEPYSLPEERLTPYAATWGVTHPCNLKCTHCYDVVGYQRHDLKTAEALEVVERLYHAGIELLVFSGGEPLLRKDLFTLMARCRDRSITIAMRSNATLITPAIVQQLCSLELAVAGISLDGADAATHDEVRGSGAFDRTMEGIRLLLERDIRVKIEIVLSRQNVHQALAFVALAESLGVDEINFSMMTPQGRAVDRGQDYLDFHSWGAVTKTLYHASQDARVNVSPSCALMGTCVACIEPNITCDGWVTPCYLSKRKLFHVLEIDPAEIVSRLRAMRLKNLDVCGRPAWAQALARQKMTVEA